MWRTFSCIGMIGLCVAATTSVALFAQANLSTNQLLRRYENAPQRSVRAGDVGRVADSFFADMSSARTSASLSTEQRFLLGRTIAYLGGLSAVAPQDRGLSLALAGAYRRIGDSLYANGTVLDRDAAILGYRNSFLILNQLAGQNPSDPAVQGELVFLGSRLRELGGMPVWFSVPIGGTMAAQEQRGIPDSVLAPNPQPGTSPSGSTLPPLPNIDPSKLSEEDQTQWRGIQDRYAGVSASVYAARTGADSLRASLEARGLTLHPDTISNIARMESSFEMGTRAIEARRWSEAKEQLDLAMAFSRRVLNTLGR
jgi:hypothetical protein